MYNLVGTWQLYCCTILSFSVVSVQAHRYVVPYTSFIYSFRSCTLLCKLANVYLLKNLV